MEDSNEVIGGPYEPLHQSVSLSGVPEVAGTLTNDAVGPVSASWRSVEESVRGMLAAPLLHRRPKRGLLDAQAPRICGCLACRRRRLLRVDASMSSPIPAASSTASMNRSGSARPTTSTWTPSARSRSRGSSVRCWSVQRNWADRVPPAFSTRHGFGIVWFAIACPTGTG